jgi:hypothetical protein
MLVFGFILEQAVLASIVRNGLEIIPKSQKGIDAIFFEGDFPSFDTAKDSALYIPKSFNFRNIDGILVHIAQKSGKAKQKLLMFPL